MADAGTTTPLPLPSLSQDTYKHPCFQKLDFTAPTRNFGHTVLTIRAEVITNVIKLLDESLFAICGFKGTYDLFDDKLPNSPFTYDYIKVKTAISFVP
ncbi:unnamed protein product [Lactuca virosa]|uniref:Uncharacterized protein n=1 Tax=Lactuca virosa TaxID=75947 RepID=A0AAU9NDK1_9ASTR|nr:unnamed protein product [Lactuca virosa]